MQIEKLNIKNSTSNDFNPVIINNIKVQGIASSLTLLAMTSKEYKPTCLTYPLKLKYPPCEIYGEKRVGGQLVALAVSVSETAYGYATGAIKGLGGLLNVATSAIGAGASWLGETVGKAATSFIGGMGKVAKTIGSAIGTIAKNVVKGVGNFVNSGFKVGKSGSLNWDIKHARKSESDAWVGVAGSIVQDWTGDIIGDTSFGIGGKDINIGKLAGSFARETIDYAHTGQFDVNVISMGAIQDSVFGRAKFGEGGGGFLSQMGNSIAENLYYSDADISGFRNTGFGISVNNKGKWGSTHNVSGGFDISDIIIGGIQQVGAYGKKLFSMPAKGLNFGLSRGNHRLAQGNIFDKEQQRQRNETNKTYPAEQTPLYTETEEDEKKKKESKKIERGDTLSKIAKNVANDIGCSEEDAIKYIKAENPQITSIHEIKAGDTIKLPTNIDQTQTEVIQNTNISEKFVRQDNIPVGIYEGSFAGVTDSKAYYDALNSSRQNPKLIPGHPEYDPELARQTKELNENYDGNTLYGFLKKGKDRILNKISKKSDSKNRIKETHKILSVYAEAAIESGVPKDQLAIEIAQDYMKMDIKYELGAKVSKTFQSYGVTTDAKNLLQNNPNLLDCSAAQSLIYNTVGSNYLPFGGTRQQRDYLIGNNKQVTNPVAGGLAFISPEYTYRSNKPIPTKPGHVVQISKVKNKRIMSYIESGGPSVSKNSNRPGGLRERYRGSSLFRTNFNWGYFNPFK